ncbi:hypothetical protein T484DRAFT_1859804 [Baffinella frigidus]|nr:hypothetical protein T484DRAFT_1859804 [Cryptophyta sp. CCMP2293]
MRGAAERGASGRFPSGRSAVLGGCAVVHAGAGAGSSVCWLHRTSEEVRCDKQRIAVPSVCAVVYAAAGAGSLVWLLHRISVEVAVQVAGVGPSLEGGPGVRMKRHIYESESASQGIEGAEGEAEGDTEGVVEREGRRSRVGTEDVVGGAGVVGAPRVAERCGDVAEFVGPC